MRSIDSNIPRIRTQTKTRKIKEICVRSLSVSDQEVLIEIVQKRLVEQRRHEIAANAQVTLLAFHEGRASYGTVEDLRNEFEA